MSTITYKCPKCSGAIVFDSKSQQFRCEYCDSVYTQEELDFFNIKAGSPVQETQGDFSGYEGFSEIEQRKDNVTANEEELENVTTYICEACGAEIVTDETTAATSCPYCDNPIIVAPQLSGGRKPDLIIPFKIQKEDAVKALKEFYKGKFLLPKIFSNENRIREVKGVYVPFWLYNCSADASVLYDATTSRRWSDSRYHYTETTYYEVYRAGSADFKGVPADASDKMDDGYMDSLEPFYHSDLIEFNQAYLSGFLADRYDVSMEENLPRVKERAGNTLADVLKTTVQGYNSVSVRQAVANINNGEAKYALLPVWILTTKYNNEKYMFAVNGQTGKVVGKLPMDKKKYWLLFLGIAGALMALVQPFVFLI